MITVIKDQANVLCRWGRREGVQSLTSWTMTRTVLWRRRPVWAGQQASGSPAITSMHQWSKGDIADSCDCCWQVCAATVALALLHSTAVPQISLQCLLCMHASLHTCRMTFYLAGRRTQPQKRDPCVEMKPAWKVSDQLLLCGRYHYNVGSTRLDVHVKKGLADGLYISSVGCATDLWGIIMDAGTGFTSQLYRVVPDAFLPKEWIMEKWDLGFYITAVAGIHCLFHVSATCVCWRHCIWAAASHLSGDCGLFPWLSVSWWYCGCCAIMVCLGQLPYSISLQQAQGFVASAACNKDAAQSRSVSLLLVLCQDCTSMTYCMQVAVKAAL